jgi:Tfp pilus assembly protein PilN
VIRDIVPVLVVLILVLGGLSVTKAVNRSNDRKEALKKTESDLDRARRTVRLIEKEVETQLAANYVDLIMIRALITTYRDQEEDTK